MERIRKESKVVPRGWLSPWISESALTPDLLQETGYKYTAQLVPRRPADRAQTRGGTLWSIPYPQELNDIPMIVARQMDGRDFADMIVDNFDEMAAPVEAPAAGDGASRCIPTSSASPIACCTCARALRHVVKQKSVWMTTPGKIYDFVSRVPTPLKKV
jgi:hypothetical protein